MLRKYTFFDGGTVEFEDTRSVKELIAYAFEEFGYYEPAGMDIVTVFQAHHPATNTGWFTTDVNAKCADEIKNPEELCFAYHMPGVFYFAEGGWGHHMKELGNHPAIPNAVALSLRFEDFRHTVVVSGNCRFRDILNFLRRTGYIPADASRVRVLHIGTTGHDYAIAFSDGMMDVPLTDFVARVEARSEGIQAEHGEYIYRQIFEIA